VSQIVSNQPSTFEAKGIGKPRLVWAPEVHERYQEKCSYFLVRLVNPNVIRRLDLAQLLEDASIKSFCVYPIYGHFDFLIRMWVTPQKRDRILRLINDQAQFDEVREFQAKKIEYLWAGQKGEDETEDHQRNHHVDKSLGDVEKIYEDIRRGECPNEAAVKRLKANRLLYEIREDERQMRVGEANKRTLYKFYFALSRIPLPNRAPRAIERVSIREFLFDLQEESELAQVSFYEGLGFADYLIKAVIPDFYAIFECNRRLINHIHDRELNLRPETFLIATADPQESDQIDISWREFGGDELRLERALSPTSGADLAELDKHERQQIAHLYVQYETKFTETPFEPFFKGVFIARIAQDRDRLTDVMSVMHRIEGYAADLFRDLWMKEFGQKWYQELKEAGKKVGLTDFDPKKFTLKNAVDVSNALPAVSKQLNLDLGPGWEAKLSALNAYRSDLAHGKAFTDPDYLIKNWEGLAKAILNVGEVYNRLHSMFHQKSVKKD